VYETANAVVEIARISASVGGHFFVVPKHTQLKDASQFTPAHLGLLRDLERTALDFIMKHMGCDHDLVGVDHLFEQFACGFLLPTSKKGLRMHLIAPGVYTDTVVGSPQWHSLRWILSALSPIDTGWSVEERQRRRTASNLSQRLRFLAHSMDFFDRQNLPHPAWVKKVFKK
jgi:hypothetical protein